MTTEEKLKLTDELIQAYSDLRDSDEEIKEALNKHTRVQADLKKKIDALLNQLSKESEKLT